MPGPLALIRPIFRRWPAQVSDSARRNLVADARGLSAQLADARRRWPAQVSDS